MSEQNYKTTEEKVQDIERYLVRQVDVIRRIAIGALGLAGIAAIASVWSAVTGAWGPREGAETPTAAHETPAARPDGIEFGRTIEPPASTPARPVDAAPPLPELTGAPKSPFRVESSAIAPEIVSLSPVGAADRFPRTQPQLFCWTRITADAFDAIPTAARSVTHRWYHDGRLVRERRITIGSSRYRVYSMLPDPGERPGAWRVDILDASGKEIGSERFVID